MADGQPVALGENQARDNPHHRQYGFQFVHELQSHRYPVKSVQARLAGAPTAAASEAGTGLAEGELASELVDEENLSLWEPGRCQVVSVDNRTVRLWDAFREKKRVLFPAGKTGFLGNVLHIPSKSVFVATASDMTLKIYDLNLENVGSVTLGKRAVYKLSFHPATSMLITAGVDGVTLWEWGEEKTEEWDKVSRLWRSVKLYSLVERRTLEDSRWAQGLELDTANNLLHVLCENSVMVYEASTGRVLDRLDRIHTLNVTDCLFSEANHYYVTSCMGGEIKIWSCARGNSLVHSFTCHTKAVTKLALHPTTCMPGLLISCSLDHSVRVFSLETLHELYKLYLSLPVNGMEVLFDRSHPEFGEHVLLTTGKTIQLWKLNHLGRPYVQYRVQPKHLTVFRGARLDAGHDAANGGTNCGSSSSSSSSSNSSSSSGAVVRSCVLVHSVDGIVRVLDAATGELVSRILPDSEADLPVAACLSPRRMVAYLLSTHSEILVFDAAHDPGLQLARWDHTALSKDFVDCLVLSPGPMPFESRLPSTQQSMSRGSAARRTMLLTAAPLDAAGATLSSASEDRPAMPTASRINEPSGEVLVGGTRCGALYVWEAGMGGRLRAVRLHAHDSPIQHMEFDPSGLREGRFVTSAKRGDVKVWNLATQQCLAHFAPRPCGAVTCLRVSPSTRLVAVGFEHGDLEIIDLETASMVEGLESEHSHTLAVRDAAFNETLGLLITVGLDGQVKVWDDRKALVRQLSFYGQPLHAMALLDDLSDLILGERSAVMLVGAAKLLPPAYNRKRVALRKEARARGGGAPSDGGPQCRRRMFVAVRDEDRPGPGRGGGANTAAREAGSGGQDQGSSPGLRGPNTAQQPQQQQQPEAAAAKGAAEYGDALEPASMLAASHSAETKRAGLAAAGGATYRALVKKRRSSSVSESRFKQLLAPMPTDLRGLESEKKWVSRQLTKEICRSRVASAPAPALTRPPTRPSEDAPPPPSSTKTRSSRVVRAAAWPPPRDLAPDASSDAASEADERLALRLSDLLGTQRASRKPRDPEPRPPTPWWDDELRPAELQAALTVHRFALAPRQITPPRAASRPSRPRTARAGGPPSSPVAPPSLNTSPAAPPGRDASVVAPPSLTLSPARGDQSQVSRWPA